MIDVTTLTDRQILEALFNGLVNKERLGASAKSDGAPPRKQPVAGFERAFGPKPSPGTPEYAEWWEQVDRTDKVFDAPPTEALAVAATKLKFRGGPDIVFIEHGGELKAAVPPADSNPNFITPKRLLESFEGLFVGGKFYL